jgi:hypothetical protein
MCSRTRSSKVRPQEVVVDGSDRGLVDATDAGGLELVEEAAEDPSVALLLVEDDPVDVVQEAIRIDAELRLVALAQAQQGAQ